MLSTCNSWDMDCTPEIAGVLCSERIEEFDFAFAIGDSLE
jgi:hypothetical protein